MLKKYFFKFGFLLLILLSLASSLFLLFGKQTLQRKAVSQDEIVFGTIPQEKIKRIWPNFSQGGEETISMLAPVSLQIAKLQPEMIRIDHLFDFPDLDGRIEEIATTGATPFLSLSYFPASVSTELTKLPESFATWQKLVRQTVQKVSGIEEKNLYNVYYEVWNEPDLFGKMSAEEYFSLYKATVEALQECQNCQPFKIGGPAITTLKKDWLNKFLNLVIQNQTRLDFLSWHSYQADPQKTLWEIQTIKQSDLFKKLPSTPELIISEWGSSPENTVNHDTYADASHTIAAMATFDNSIDKIFTFEIKDGPDPQGKKYWGRWGLITHQNFGVSLKPKFYVYPYLNQLLNRKLKILSSTPNLTAIGSTDGKEAYAFLITQTNNGQASNLKFKISGLAPGLYTSNLFNLDSLHNPLFPIASESAVVDNNFQTDLALANNGTLLLELARSSAALEKTEGKANLPEDFAAKISSSLPAVEFPFYLQIPIEKMTVKFAFKPTLAENEEFTYRSLFDNKDQNGNGIEVWLDKNNFGANIVFGLMKKNQPLKEIQIPFFYKSDKWYDFSFELNLLQKKMSASVDKQSASLSLDNEFSPMLGNKISFGKNSQSRQIIEGNLDNFELSLNEELFYQTNFNQ